MIDHRVAVCRDHAKDACKRQQCKYYHIPVAVPPANVMANIYKTSSNSNDTSSMGVYSADISITSIPPTILNSSTIIKSDTLNNKNMANIIATSSKTTTATTTRIDATSDERHCPPIRNNRSATQTH